MEKSKTIKIESNLTFMYFQLTCLRFLQLSMLEVLLLLRQLRPLVDWSILHEDEIETYACPVTNARPL